MDPETGIPLQQGLFTGTAAVKWFQENLHGVTTLEKAAHVGQRFIGECLLCMCTIQPSLLTIPPSFLSSTLFLSLPLITTLPPSPPLSLFPSPPLVLPSSPSLPSPSLPPPPFPLPHPLTLSLPPFLPSLSPSPSLPHRAQHHWSPIRCSCLRDSRDRSLPVPGGAARGRVRGRYLSQTTRPEHHVSTSLRARSSLRGGVN